MRVISPCLIYSFIILKCPSLSLVFKFFPDVLVLPLFSHLHEVSFPSFSFQSLCVSFTLKWVSCGQYTCESWFLSILTLCLSIGAFSSWTFFFKDFILFLDRGRGAEREGEKHQCVVASWAPPTRDLACNPGMYPDWESNQQPFSSQAGAQSTEPHQLGLVHWHLK